MLKVKEIYEKEAKEFNVRPDGSEYYTFSKSYDTRQSLINPNYIVSVRPYAFTSSLDLDKLEGVFPHGTKFSIFVMDGNSFRSSEIVVVGSFDKYVSLLGGSDQ